MRIPHAAFRFVLLPVAFAILAASALSAQVYVAINSKPASPIASAERLVLTPANLYFGNVAIGRRNLRTTTITNLGNSSITLHRVITKGAGFALSGLDLPLSLARGESFTFSSVFAPQSRGYVEGSISFVSDASRVASPILKSVMTGTGTDSGQLTVDPPTINFGTVPVGSVAVQGATLTATGSAVTISSVNISDPEFTIGGLSFPFTIPAGGTQGYTVQFAPQTSGGVSATLSFLTDGGSVIQSLTGVGAAGQSHSVDLSWNASTSQDVIGYNVYRGTTSGGPYNMINTVLDASTVYTDTSVSDGTTYYYVTRAVDSSNQESVNSNEAQAVIPGEDSRGPGPTRSSPFSRRIAQRRSPLRNH